MKSKFASYFDSFRRCRNDEINPNDKETIEDIEKVTNQLEKIVDEASILEADQLPDGYRQSNFADFQNAFQNQKKGWEPKNREEQIHRADVAKIINHARGILDKANKIKLASPVEAGIDPSAVIDSARIDVAKTVKETIERCSQEFIKNSQNEPIKLKIEGIDALDKEIAEMCKFLNSEDSVTITEEKEKIKRNISLLKLINSSNDNEKL